MAVRLLGGKRVQAAEQGVRIRRRTRKEPRRSGFDAETQRRVLPTKQPLDFERLIGLDLREVIDPVHHALDTMLVLLAYAFQGVSGAGMVLVIDRLISAASSK